MTDESRVWFYFPRRRVDAVRAVRTVEAARTRGSPRTVTRSPDGLSSVVFSPEVPGIEGGGSTREEAERDLDGALDELAAFLRAMVERFTREKVNVLRRRRAARRRR